MSEKPHGNGRYRDGCRCDECRAGHAAAARGRRGVKPNPEPGRARLDARDPQPDGMGPIEIAVRSDLLALEEDCPLSATLKALALEHARRLDRLDEISRPDLASPLHQRLMDALHELSADTKGPEGNSSLDELIRNLTEPS